MDRALKERLIGAVALFAIAVLVVPVFLDGPSTDAEIVSEAVTLPGQNEQTRKRQTIVLERERDQPVPAPTARSAQETTAAEKLAADEAAREALARASGAQNGTAAEAPAAQNVKPAPKQPDPAPASTVAKADAKPADPSPAPADGAAAQSATGMWAVQLGSFSEQPNAERLAAELRSNGYAAFLSQLKTSSGSLHRVRVGPQKDRESAEAVASRLSGDGHKGQVVPHP